ncbi:MAG TPA: class I SAM-dependent methyltransferase [Thermoleophilaceae bacterium]|nr:class I SAM-dependent methyltransferase [Thermoleophilaceae bacterium]
MAGRDTYGKPPPHGAAGGASAISRRSLFRLRLSGAARRDIDDDAVIRRVRACWERNGHEPLLRQLEPAAELLADLALVAPGKRVLDAAAGDGNVALASARRGAEVDACDLAARMVERGRARCPVASWRVADLQALPYEDGEFDAVLSSFGAHLAPKPQEAAGELVRVTRPGGFVALAAWIPRGLPGRMDELVEPYAPLPDGVPRPDRWGVEGLVRRRLAPLLEDLQLRMRTLPLRFDSVDAAFEALLRPHPVDDGQRQAVRPAFERLLGSCNNRPPAVEIDARYLVAVGRRGHDGGLGSRRQRSLGGGGS